jgi:hypothetical protein
MPAAVARQVVIDAGSGDVRAAAARIRRAGQQLIHAGDAAGLTTQAEVLLAAVDGMERLYG